MGYRARFSDAHTSIRKQGVQRQRQICTWLHARVEIHPSMCMRTTAGVSSFARNAIMQLSGLSPEVALRINLQAQRQDP